MQLSCWLSYSQVMIKATIIIIEEAYLSTIQMYAGHTEVILYLFMMVIFGSYNPTYVLYWPVCYCWVRAGLNMTHRSREKQTLNMQLVHVVCIQQLHMWSTSPLLCTQTYPLRQMSLDKLWPWNEEKEKILYIIIRMSSSTRIFLSSYIQIMMLQCCYGASKTTYS